MSDDELRALREKYKNQLNQSQPQESEEAVKERKAQEESIRQNVLRKILSDKARERLNNIKLVKPQLAENIEVQLIQLVQRGRISSKLSEEQLLQLLKQFSNQKRDSKIEFRRV